MQDHKHLKLETRRQFGLALTYHREECGLTQKAVAEAVGTSQPAVARIEAGQQNISLGLADALCRAVDATLADLLDNTYEYSVISKK
jgi:UDP-N-acetylglucosamine 1-carboxyvinyltransferase